MIALAEYGAKLGKGKHNATYFAESKLSSQIVEQPILAAAGFQLEPAPPVSATWITCPTMDIGFRLELA